MRIRELFWLNIAVGSWREGLTHRFFSSHRMHPESVVIFWECLDRQHCAWSRKKTKKNNNVSIIFKVVPLYQTLSSVEGTCFEVYEENKSNHIITYRAVPSAASVIFTYRRNAAFIVQIWGVYYFFLLLLTVQAIRNWQKSSLSLHLFQFIHLEIHWIMEIKGIFILRLSHLLIWKHSDVLFKRFHKPASWCTWLAFILHSAQVSFD